MFINKDNNAGEAILCQVSGEKKQYFTNLLHNESSLKPLTTPLQEYSNPLLIHIVAGQNSYA